MKNRGGVAACACALVLSGLTFSVGASAQYNNCGFNGSNGGWASSENGYDEQISFAPASSEICWLIHLEGNWPGTGQYGGRQGVEVIVERDGYWHVVTHQSGDIGFASCLPKSCFIGKYSGYSVVWDNQSFSQSQQNYWNESALADTFGNGPDYDSNNNGYPGVPGTYSGHTFLQGWPLGQGATNGGGEQAGVNENAGGPNTLYAQTGVENEEGWGLVLAEFGSIFVGSLYTSTPTYLYSSGWTTGTYTIDLGLNGTQAMCFLTKVQGAFRGSRAEVYTAWNGSAYEWYADTNQGSGYQLGANYGCMGFYQDH